MAPVIGPVLQQADAFKVPVERLPSRYPVLAVLCDELAIQIHRVGR